MNKGKALFVTGTATDVGKTFISALLIKKMIEEGINCGYYKAAASGAESCLLSDAGYVNQIANINQLEETLLSYLYKTPVSPHLAAKIEGNPLNLRKVKKDFQVVRNLYEYILMEGSGGIICPLRFDDEKIMLIDLVKEFQLATIIVADAGLGTINATVLTVSYLHSQKVPIRGIILNNYDGSYLHQDNLRMIEELTNEKVIATVRHGAMELDLNKEQLKELFKEGS